MRVVNGLETVKLRKVRGIIPDGLFQARISNYVASFPNLGGGPLSNENDKCVGGGGISRKRKPEQLNSPDCKRSRESMD